MDLQSKRFQMFELKANVIGMFDGCPAKKLQFVYIRRLDRY